MKRYIRASIPTDVPYITVDIDVIYEAVSGSVAAAFSNIRPVYDGNGEIDEQALADYDNFVEEVIGEMEYHDFKLLRASESKSSVTSRYYTFANEQQVEAKDIKYIVFLRISEHHAMLDEDQKAWVREQRQKDLEKFKMPKTKKKQRFKLKEILVNNEVNSSYDEALEETIKRIIDWENSVK
jgi:hypothetical protein